MHDHEYDCVHDHSNGNCDHSSDFVVSLSVPHSHEHDKESNNENFGFMRCEHDANKFEGYETAEDCAIGTQKMTSEERLGSGPFAIIDTSNSQQTFGFGH